MFFMRRREEQIKQKTVTFLNSGSKKSKENKNPKTPETLRSSGVF